jgi:hypothetical protein
LYPDHVKVAKQFQHADKRAIPLQLLQENKNWNVHLHLKNPFGEQQVL